jgi:hypothetical protein
MGSGVAPTPAASRLDRLTSDPVTLLEAGVDGLRPHPAR